MLRFLRSEFLYYLPLAALPALIHLLSRKKAVIYVFPSIRLLKKDALSKTTDFNLMSILLLLIRTAALFFLVMYFAGPSFVLGKKEAASPGAAAVFADHSYSMNRAHRGSTLWEDACRTAGEIVRALGEENPSVFVFNKGFSFEGRGEEGAAALFAKKKPAAVSESFSDGLSKFLEQNRTIKRVFVISDFSPGSFKGETAIPRDARLLCLRVGETSKNFFVRSCGIYDEHIVVFPSLFPGGKEEYALSAWSGTERINTIPASGVSAAITVPGEYLSGRVELDNADVLTDDNVFFYSRPDREKTSIPVLRAGGGALDRDGAYFIRKMIERSSLFSAEAISDSSLFGEKLKAARAAVITAPNAISSALSGALRAWVAKGGLLILFPDDDSSAQVLNSQLADLLPGRIYPVKEQAIEGGISLDVPWAGDDFGEEHYGKLSVLKFFPVRCREDALELIKAGGETLSSAVRFGEGAVMLFSMPADMTFSNLPVVAGFPPFFLRSLEYFVYERKEFRRNYFVGERISLPAGASLSFGGIEVEVKAGPDGLGLSVPVEDPGLYDVSGKGVSGRIAVNLGRGEENDLSVMTSAEIKKLFQGSDVFDIKNPEAEIAHILRGKNLSDMALLLFIMLLCAEIALAYKLNHSA
ncbi:BatA domain-containing protein [bacterium]|nr:hypothetical protein [Candidatus Omnitrophota bacterium]MBU2527762.1 BatA domain-containing protein [bacterium]MBU3930438.1 BatA domain-containing protein [bacterium]MBU4122557.1 BatA domain-containing protein [bacterium]